MMATSVQDQSSKDEMEVKTYPCCSPCSDDGSHTAAGHYCVECELYFCGKCVKCHNMIPSLKSHQLNDVDNPDLTTVDSVDEQQRSGSPDPLKCSLHPDQCIDTYCKDHDEVGCGICFRLEHRLCTIEPIATSAKGFKVSPEVKQGNEELINLVTRFEKEKKKRIDNLALIGVEKMDQIQVVNAWEEDTISTIKKMADTSRQEIRSKHVEHETGIDCEVSVLDASVTELKEHKRKIGKVIDNEQLLFVQMKSIKTRSRVAERLLQVMSMEWKERAITFHIDKEFNNSVQAQTSIGQLGNDFNEYNARLLKDANAKTFYNMESPCIYDMCLMGSGDILMADNANKKLKRFRSNDLQCVDELQLSNQPVAVCKVGDNKVAARMRSSNIIQMVSVETHLNSRNLESTSSFTVDGEGYGMAYDAISQEMYVCEEDKISIYTKEGNKVRTIEKEVNGEWIFSACRQIALSEKNQDIYVIDKNKGLVILDKNGTLKMTVPLNGARDWQPLCLLPEQICLVGGENANVIGQINKFGTRLGNLIDTKGNPTHCAVYDKETSRLFVGGQGTKNIFMYSVSVIDGTS